jgi:hypothetical protein
MACDLSDSDTSLNTIIVLCVADLSPLTSISIKLVQWLKLINVQMALCVLWPLACIT